MEGRELKGMREKRERIGIGKEKAGKWKGMGGKVWKRDRGEMEGKERDM